jgi:hypothetical protein
MVWARSYEAEDFGSNGSLTYQPAAGEKGNYEVLIKNLIQSFCRGSSKDLTVFHI